MVVKKKVGVKKKPIPRGKIKGWKKTEDTRRSLNQKSWNPYITEGEASAHETWRSEDNNKIILKELYNMITKKSIYIVNIYDNNKFENFKNKIDSIGFKTHKSAEKYVYNFMKNNIGTKLKGWEVIYYKNKKIIGRFKSIKPPHDIAYKYAKEHLFKNIKSDKNIKVNINKIF